MSLMNWVTEKSKGFSNAKFLDEDFINEVGRDEEVEGKVVDFDSLTKEQIEELLSIRDVNDIKIHEGNMRVSRFDSWYDVIHKIEDIDSVDRDFYKSSKVIGYRILNDSRISLYYTYIFYNN